MARPRTFDPDAALDAVMDVFWLQGFEATSIDDLVRATGVNRYSLYQQWGDKQGLFLAALARYGDRVAAEWIGRIAAAPEPLDGIRVAFRTLAEAVLADPDRRSCLVLQTALELGRSDPVVQPVVRELLDRMQGALHGAIERAVATGALPATTDTAAHARHLAVAFQAVLLQARTGAPPETVRDFVTLTLSTLPPEAP
ncbi:MAG: TetR/AcrR family transcriptional regulator [Alphaproteobacteria bacterium]|nr:TetR/AcrR family transcriptional regulator [Alphaproteobacteria bacterium]